MILIGEGPSTSTRLMFEPVTSNFSSFTGSVGEFDAGRVVLVWAKPTATTAEATRPARTEAGISFIMVFG